jgi:hypothetical protein
MMRRRRDANCQYPFAADGIYGIEVVRRRSGAEGLPERLSGVDWTEYGNRSSYYAIGGKLNERHLGLKCNTDRIGSILL